MVQSIVSRLAFWRTPLAACALLTFIRLCQCRLVLTHRSVIHKLVLIDVGPLLHHPGIVRISTYAAAGPIVAATIAELGVIYRDRFSTMQKLSAAMTDRFVVHHARRMDCGKWTMHTDPAAPANLKNDVLDIVSPSPKEHPWVAFEMVACPVLVVRGASSDLLSVEIVDGMKAHQVPGRVLSVEIPDAGHVPLLQTPLEFDALFSFAEREDFPPSERIHAAP